MDQPDIIAEARTLKETDRKCPECGGTMDYSPEAKGLLCPYCGHAEEVPSGEEEIAQELDFSDAEHKGNCDWGVEKKTVICKSCSAESIYDALEVSNVCPYCGSNQVTEAADEKTLAPNGVCPFEVTARQAGENFTKWIKGKLFTPSAAKKSARPDAFKGVYLPYWTFDTDTKSRYTARYGIDKQVKKQDGTTETQTTWYNTSGLYNHFFDDQLVIATNRYDADLMRRIEPFRTAESKGYKPEYVAGYISERYSIGLQQGWETAKAAIDATLRSNITGKIRSERNADRVDRLRVWTNYADLKYKYLMLPVWLSSFTFQKKVYRFMVNGQTGAVGGKAPVSALRVTIAILIGIALLALLIWLFSMGK